MDTQFLFSLITGIFVGGTAGFLGSLMITKRMALVGDALGHIALPGMGLALFWGLNPSLGAFVFLFLGILFIWFLELKTNLPTETLVGIVFVFSLALGILITPEDELLHALVGDISKASLIDTFFAVILSILVFYVVNKIYPKMILSSISEELAVVNKINIKKYNFLYFLAIAIIVALGIKVVGSLLIGALVIIPAASSRMVNINMGQYRFSSAFLGILSVVLGIIFSKITNLPIGPLIILICILFFLITLIFKKR